MKVSLGCGDMGISAHLQASKTGNTRFFTSNTHSSVVLQVSSSGERLRDGAAGKDGQIDEPLKSHNEICQGNFNMPSEVL